MGHSEFGLETSQSPATLLIVDRVDDIAPALMHDFTYSGLVVDMLNHDPCSVSGKRGCLLDKLCVCVFVCFGPCVLVLRASCSFV